MLVDPNTLVYPTPKSDGAAVLAMTQNAKNFGGNGGNVSDDDDDDLDNFSDINSQDDALTKEKKEQKN